MMRLFCILSIFTLISNFFIETYAAANSQYFTYLEPSPGAQYVSRETAIILKPSGLIPGNTITNKSIEITGSISGLHEGQIIKSDDNSTILFKPNTIFAAGETITVKFLSNNKARGQKNIVFFEYTFTVKSAEIKPDILNILNSELQNNQIFQKPNSNNRDGDNSFPQLTIKTSENPSAGNIFLSNFVFNSNIPNTPYLMILDNSANPVFSREMTGTCFDFKAQPNGNYTYYDIGKGKFYEMNKSYSIIDSFYCGNGYTTDAHELRVLDNGNALLISYDPEVVNMVQYLGSRNSVLIDTNTADTAAVVLGLIVQEIDINKNVVFQWRSWDHFRITDATHENLFAHSIDYVHGNAVELDNDGNLLISCRHMDEITKINRQTGDIIWRLGGKNNQFTFINDPIGFSHQHAIRRIKNGDITLYDNGNFHTPSFSRAVEYTLDEYQMKANLVWQYRNNPDIYGSAMGYVERLDNGNTLIGWGAANPSVTEVRYDGTKEYELSMPLGVFSYRAFRSQAPVETAIPSQFSLSQNFPNPFNPGTTIQFSLPKDSYVKLIVYDILGREVSSIVNENLKAGSYESQWNGTGFSSGIYFYKLVTDGFVESKKMILVK